MKLIQTVASAEGFRDPASNPARLGLLGELIRVCAREEARLLLVPAGFLTAHAEGDVPTLIREVDRLASGAAIAVIGGVDVAGRASKRAGNVDDLVRRGELPYFGFAVGSAVLPAESGHPWRQTSTNNSNADFVAEGATPGEGRVTTIDGTRVGTLVCGELFSWRARQGLGQAGARLVVDIGHSGMNQGLIPAMRAVATQGKCCVAHTHHVKDRTRPLHFVDGRGQQLSIGANPAHLVQHDSLWAAWAARQV